MGESLPRSAQILKPRDAESSFRDRTASGHGRLYTHIPKPF
jgi:hypothetical protein